jgi:hypothetical protein
MTPIIIASLLFMALYLGTKRLSGLGVLLIITMTVGGIGLVLFPGFSTHIANYVHVGRGTDLILYLAILGGLFVASNFFLRFQRHEEALIALARQSAIDHAQDPSSEPTHNLGTESNRAVQ